MRISIDVVKALLMLTKVCASATGCETCVLKEFCGKTPMEW